MSLIGSGLAMLLASRRDAPGAPSIDRALALAADWTELHLNGGRPAHAALAWTLLVIGLASVAALTGALLAGSLWLLSALLSVYLLWLVLRWRPVAMAFDRLRWALAEGRPDLALEVLDTWPVAEAGSAGMPDAAVATQAAVSSPPSPLAIAESAIGRAAADLLRDVYAPLFWFALLPGGAGAVLCRVGEALALRWGQSPEPAVRDTFGQWALLARDRVEALPARVTAALAAIVGDAAATAEAWRATPPAAGGRLAGARPLVVACAQGALGASREAADSDDCARAVARLDSAARLQRRVLVGWLLLMLLPALVS